ncbi:hypothetical protein [Spirosoma aerolatum]|uniref:hypothetical protein n=1 Tax=Spirosoma aerolatum TaxID=1211326 RepID=UPI0009AC8C15|nr:hypothetical protein [Spirosoma aerolatum]
MRELNSIWSDIVNEYAQKLVQGEVTMEQFIAASDEAGKQLSDLKNELHAKRLIIINKDVALA